MSVQNLTFRLPWLFNFLIHGQIFLSLHVSQRCLAGNAKKGLIESAKQRKKITFSLHVGNSKPISPEVFLSLFLSKGLLVPVNIRKNPRFSTFCEPDDREWGLNKKSGGSRVKSWPWPNVPSKQLQSRKIIQQKYRVLAWKAKIFHSILFETGS